MAVLVRLLGPVDVHVDGAERALPGLRRKAVLARLALRPGEVVGVAQLIDAVWDGDPPAGAHNSLQSHISYLRRALGDPGLIRAQSPGYVFADRRTDLGLAEELIGLGRGATSPAQRLKSLEQALKLWRGEPLADVAELSWFAHEAERLARIRREAQRVAVECRLDLGEHAALAPELAKMAEREQFDEELHGQLMIALYRGGRQAEALSVFQRLRERLHRALGIDPSARLRDLYTAILRQDPSLDFTPAPVAAPVERLPALIERSSETTAIERALAHTLNTGSGRVLVFEGPAGIGKTSLLGHARRRAAVTGFTVLSARGTDLETDYGWGCVRQLFDRPAEDDRLTSLLPDQGSAGGEYQTITSLFWLANDLATAQPLLILLDDVHWADTASVRFLAFLAARLDSMPAVLVLAFRPGHERISRFTASVTGLPHTISRTPQPLSREGSAEMLSDLVAADLDPELSEQCWTLARGNPLLLRELAQHMAESGGERVVLEGSPSVQRFVSQQLDALPQASVDVARALAVLGDGARTDEISQVLETSAQEVLSSSGPLLARQLAVSEGLPARLAFTHPMIQQAVYDLTTMALRSDLHLRAIRTAGSTRDPVRAAGHLLRVPPGIVDPAEVAQLSAAADLSLQRGSVTGAISFLRRLLEEDLGDLRTETLARLGAVEALVDTDAAIGRLTEARARQHDPDARAMTSFGLASTLFLAGRPREAIDVCVGSLEDDQEISASARQLLQGNLVITLYVARSGADLVPLADAYRREVPGATTGGFILDAGMALHAMYRNRREEAERRALNVIRATRLIESPFVPSALSTAFFTLIQCDSTALLPAMEQALDHGTKTGSLNSMGHFLWTRSEAMYARGHLAEALGDARQSWEVTELSSMGLGLLFIGNVLLHTLVDRGETGEAAKVLERVKELHSPGVTPGIFASGEIAVHLACGDTLNALETAERTRDELADLRSNPLVSDWRAPLVHCHRRLGRMDEARAAAEELVALSAEWGSPRALGRALRSSALVETGRRRLEILEESVRLLERSQANLERARSLTAFGECLLENGHHDDALARLSSALDLASFCGARPLKTRIESTIERAGGSASSGGALSALTPTEERVAALASRGVSPREMAEQLRLTVDAVHRHLAAVTAKSPN